ncbi:Cellulose synthase protein [Dioscorea alata]|nr:Cellulose synthase protein [Dioscorea alata]
MSTVLSMMAYDYPKEKLSVYLSDDAGSELTFYALCEACKFAKHWIPFCNKFDVEPRSPNAFFYKSCHSSSSNLPISNEWSKMKDMYEEMINRINFVVAQGKVPQKLKQHQGFSKWTSDMIPRNHDAVIQILVDRDDENSVDNENILLPRVIYVAREKRHQHHHNFKAGSMNVLLRVSSQISNGPIILNVDCDMYSNNSQSIKDALCFFLDEKKGHEIGFVQYPQYYDNITKNDLYDNSLNVLSMIDLPGMDGFERPLYIGSGCFHRREALEGRKYSKGYIEDWNRGVDRTCASACVLEEKVKHLASCIYEHNTLWGKEIGLRYGCAAEDMLTGLAIHYKGWKSKYMDLERKAFLGVGPTTLEQNLLQRKRWSEGGLQIFLSKSSPLLFGHQKIKFGACMGYSIYNLWAANSFPTLTYLLIPPLFLLNNISLFPKVSSPWFIPFVLVFIAKHTYSLIESLYSGNTFKGWWNSQRMWLLVRITSYFYAIIDNILNYFGASKLAFTITAKVSDEEALKQYEQEVMDCSSTSSMFVIISTVALINLFCLFGEVMRMILNGEGRNDDALSIQVAFCGLVVAINVPIYEGLFLRKDKGRMPYSVTSTSLGIAMLVCILSMHGLSFA